MNDIPHIPEAERAIVGHVIRDGELYPRVSGILAEDFYLLECRAYWQAFKRLYDRGAPIDQVTVSHELRAMKELETVGGLAGIMDMMVSVPLVAHPEIYAELVQAMAVRRRMLYASDAIRRAALDQHGTVQDALSAAETAVQDVARFTPARNQHSMYDLADSAFDRMSAAIANRINGAAMVGIPYGWHEIDKLLLGAQQSQYIIVAARPGMGKSVFSAQTAYNMAVRGRRVLFFSTEMSKDDVFDRIITIHTGIPFYAHRSGTMTPQQRQRYTDAVAFLSNLPIMVIDESEARPSFVRAMTERAIDRTGVDCVIVDGTYRMATDGTYRSLYERGNEIATAMKNLARRCQIPVIGTHQIGRDGDTRRPVMSDLSESGRYEQEADVVLGLWREIDTEPTHLEAIVLKHRNGATGTAHLYFEADLMTIRNAEIERHDLTE